ncbi:MAG: hypothetical protein AABY13_00175 [Nanoarchaeota archaeon]
MVFVRTKKIGGKAYAYLVENHWEGGRARQKVKQYLGRVHTPIKKDDLVAPDLKTHAFSTAVQTLIAHELQRHGFAANDNTLVNDGIVVNVQEGVVHRNGKPAALRLNEGILCSYTLGQLLQYTPAENEGALFARRLVEAGLSVPQETFVTLFQKAQPSE